MVDIDGYLRKFIHECKNVFGERLLYVGLQGSYMRGEANENSDIDMMVLIESFSAEDMVFYREMLDRLPYREKSCGFICGREELSHWNRLEIFQLRNTTKDLFGRLSDYLPAASREDEVNYVKLSLGNFYHELCHRYIHGDRSNLIEWLRGGCKGLFYIIRELHYLESGRYLLTRAELKSAVSERDRAVMEIAELPGEYDFKNAFNEVFSWCRDAFGRADRAYKEE